MSQSCFKHSTQWVNEVEWVSMVKVILWPWSKVTQISKLNVWLLACILRWAIQGLLALLLFSSILFCPLSPSLWEMARYRLKYCLKGPLSPKQPTIQPSLEIFRVLYTSSDHCGYLQYLVLDLSFVSRVESRMVWWWNSTFETPCCYSYEDSQSWIVMSHEYWPSSRYLWHRNWKGSVKKNFILFKI